MQDDGYVETAGDRLRAAFRGPPPTRRAWALYAVFAQRAAHDEEAWHAVAQAMAAERAAGGGTDDALLGIMLLGAHRQTNGQYDPFLRAARHLAARNVATTPAGRIAWAAFLATMADSVPGQAEAASRLRARAGALFDPADDAAAPEWAALAHAHRPRRSRAEWRLFCTQRLLSAPMTSMKRFVAVYCALVLAQDHRLISRLADAPSPDTESVVWRAMEESLLLSRHAGINPLGAVGPAPPRGAQPGTPYCGPPWWIYVAVLVCLTVVVVAVLMRHR